MKAIWNGQVIADSDKTLEVAGYRYFPRDSVRMELLQKTERTTSDRACPNGRLPSMCSIPPRALWRSASRFRICAAAAWAASASRLRLLAEGATAWLRFGSAHELRGAILLARNGRQNRLMLCDVLDPVCEKEKNGH